CRRAASTAGTAGRRVRVRPRACAAPASWARTGRRRCGRSGTLAAPARVLEIGQALRLAAPQLDPPQVLPAAAIRDEDDCPRIRRPARGRIAVLPGALLSRRPGAGVGEDEAVEVSVLLQAGALLDVDHPPPVWRDLHLAGDSETNEVIDL